MDSQALTILFAFGSVASLAYFAVAVLLGGGRGEKLRSRLRGGDELPAVVRRSAVDGTLDVLQRLGDVAAGPFAPPSRGRQSRLRRTLSHAGIYQPSAAKAVTGAKLVLLVVGLIVGGLAGLATRTATAAELCLLVGAVAGYAAPSVWLRTRVARNQRALEYGLADAIDLMVVCVEAGLTVDSAMQRVGEELALVHPSLSRELNIAHMETRVGLSRVESLRNLGARTGSAALQSLSSMLIQADRFGTSIAQALRVHAQSLRVARMHRAEELAAKSAVKISFPLVLFIFPATFIVLAGPTIIDLLHSPLFAGK